MTMQDIPFQTIDGETTSLGELGAPVVLVVNVASRCGLTPQYEALEELQKKYGPRGFTVVGFPSNQFNQELDSADAIKEFCSLTWGVTFPMAEKVEVNGPTAHPLFTRLTQYADANGEAGDVEWNFEKFLVGRGDGEVARFRPKTLPDSPEVVSAIESALAAVRRDA
ncbi:glutathione peroxidase [Leifsonia sp. NPDC058194]|uniref:glutathione peroxidase n=1 Tax=Leifsonia sp. NPDC058194 TaxID=3346374 RepID=UPI0036DF9F02